MIKLTLPHIRLVSCGPAAAPLELVHMEGKGWWVLCEYAHGMEAALDMRMERFLWASTVQCFSTARVPKAGWFRQFAMSLVDPRHVSPSCVRQCLDL